MVKQKTIEDKKQIIKNKIKTNGFVEKINKKETKPYQQNADVLSAYNSDDVVITYDGKDYTVNDITSRFEKIEYIMRPCIRPRKVGKKGIITSTLTEEVITVRTLPNKANNSETRSRHIPIDYIIIKYKGEKAAIAVPQEIFFKDITTEKYNNTTSAILNVDVDKTKFSAKDFPGMVKFLSSCPECVGYSTPKRCNKKDFKTFGNDEYKKIMKMSNERLMELYKDIVDLHKAEVEQKNLEKLVLSGEITDEQRKRLEELNIFTKGRNERIKEKYGFRNRGILTDIRVWISLMSDNKTIAFTEFSKEEAIYVIPRCLAKFILRRLTDKDVNTLYR